jgi:hypothetical protein
MAYDTGIAPNDLLDADPAVLRAMFDYRADLAREMKKQRRAG